MVKGFCGTVWAHDDEVYAFKREDGGPGRDLLNDYNIHKHLLKTAANHMETSQRLTIPLCHQFINADDRWWAENPDLFPEQFTPCRTLVSERIPPLALPVREILIDKYCPTHMREKIKSNLSNRDCMVRPYLVKRRRQFNRPSRLAFFTLRNLPLHLESLQELQLDVEGYAIAMAEALAVMHWVAEVDANDVEFVLAGPSTHSKPFDGASAPATSLGEHKIWVLDFDCCRTMSMDDLGIANAARAFIRNDPYCPRPSESREDEQLWRLFRAKYLETSSNILKEGSRTDLPTLFVQMVEEQQAARDAHKRSIE